MTCTLTAAGHLGIGARGESWNVEQPGSSSSRGAAARGPWSSDPVTLIVVNYHYVRPGFEHRFPGIHGVTTSALRAQLQLLGTAGEFVSLNQVRDAAGGATSLPRRAFLVTFDDGLREQLEHALPVLDELGVPGVFFVNTWPIANRAVSSVHKIHLLRAHTPPAVLCGMLHAEARRQGLESLWDVESGEAQVGEAQVKYPWDPPESAQLKYFLNHQLTHEVKDALIAPCFREVFGDDESVISDLLYMDVEQLRMLGARGYLGTHGDQHLPLGRLPRAAVHDNVRLSLDRLLGWTDVRPFALSYPFGSLETSTLEAGAIAAELGVELGFTTERAVNVDLTSPLHLARFDCNDLPGGRQPYFQSSSLFENAPAARWYR